MMTQQAAASLSPFTCSWTYDVFLSFRGEDTRLGFTGSLYNSLCQKGIFTFIDDEGLIRGEEITPALLKAIQESRISIIVFSKNYASSTFCLNELVEILQCSKVQGRMVLPIFYDVDPSQVRHQTGSYAEALAKHEEKFKDDKGKVQQWRKALCQAANLSGCHFQQGYQSEYKFIIEIVEEVFKKINRPPIHVGDKLVGLESRVLKVTSLLRLGSDDGVNMVGIYGIGGIGKTTVARAVYNLIADQFEGLCFLANIREKTIDKHGLVQLQETLLCEMLQKKDIKVGDVNGGIPIVKRRLQQKKVLLILDDVDKLVQLKALAGGCDWFGSGSKIIITTRDKHLLVTHGVVNLYEVEQLSDEKALQLFSWHAFKSNKVDTSYVDISKRAVLYACGLPLALEVLGSQLFSKSLEECYSALDKYERIPHRDIHEMLKVSYDGLEEDEKGIFLDIACFFNTYKLDYVKEMLHKHGFHAEDGIRVLANKSLLKIDDDGFVRMHDLFQDMGREIVRQESTIEPGKRSRLWFNEDIVHVLEENTGTDNIEVIMLKAGNKKNVQWSGKAFKKMKNLRILIIGNTIFTLGPLHLPNSLRVLDWSNYPSLSLPSAFNPKELMILKLPASRFKFIQPLKRFESLWSIDFEGCKFLTEIPSLSELPIRHLCLDNCSNLIRIDASVGFLENLLSLSAKGCTRLEILVPCINLTSLEVLDLTGCSNLKCFPEVLGKMDKIRSIYLDATSINKLPFSIANLVGLERLWLRGCLQLNQLPNSIHTLPKVEVITGYSSSGFYLFDDKRKVSSKSEVAPGAMVLVEGGMQKGFTRLDVYYEYISPNNVIKLCTPKLLENPRLESNHKLLFKVLYERPNAAGKMDTSRRKSVTQFAFRNNFPKITVCCARERRMAIGVDNFVWHFKLKVLIDGTEQFSSSCTYINTWRPICWSQKLCCDLKCKAEGVFSENKWNFVEILCELEYPMPCDCEWQIATKFRNKGRFMRCTHIYVDMERDNMNDVQLYDASSNSMMHLDNVDEIQLYDASPNSVGNIQNLERFNISKTDSEERWRYIN